jgi:hypothetical protein
MNKKFTSLTVLTLSVGCLMFTLPVRAQVDRGLVPEVITPVRSDISLPLREMPLLPLATGPNRLMHEFQLPRPADTGPAPDSVAQELPREPIPFPFQLNFNGQHADNVAPPDTNGAVGATQYVQWVNLVFNIYDKNTGTKLAGPFPGTQFWAGFGGPCQTQNGGDPIIQYDKAAGRWVAQQIAFATFSAASICVAVSTTSDALGSYARYEYAFGNQFPDYPKLGVWPDAYYLTVNTFPNGTSFAGARACALDRSKMLLGMPAPTAICFQLTPTDSSLLPSDLDGSTPPPAGSPNYNIDLGTSTTLRLWKFHVDFAVPANSTFTGPTLITVASYTQRFANIPQPSPGELLDSLGDRLMYRLAYRNFGTHEAIVANHTVDNASKAAVRWYEIRSPGTTPTVFQQGTIAASLIHLWMGSIAQDKMGNIAIGFSASNNTTIKPSVVVAGRVPSDPAGTITFRSFMVRGTGVQTFTSNRWGDYSAMVIDPIDDCTLWYTQEYYITNGSFNWDTRIGKFSFPTCP